jgi:hypothetical protein
MWVLLWGVVIATVLVLWLRERRAGRNRVADVDRGTGSAELEMRAKMRRNEQQGGGGV